jgi:hypothetical protein
MSYREPLRAFPTFGRSVAAVTSAIVLPSFLYIQSSGGWTRVRTAQDVAGVALFLAFFVGQAALLAIPVVLMRWRRMRDPLVECVIFGTLLAPGPIGLFFCIGFLLGGPPSVALRFWVPIAASGAVGGFAGWAVATRFGKDPLVT